MSRAELFRIATAGPADHTGLAELSAFDPRTVRAVVGKTEGNGCVNDFSRELAARSWGERLPGDPLTIMSGGTEGVLSPHVTLLAEVPDEPGGEPGALAIGVAKSDPIAPQALGRKAQVEAVAAAVKDACQGSGIEPHDVSLALVKCPLLDADALWRGAAEAPGPITEDPYESMSRSRGASALGVGLAVGELDPAAVESGLDGDTTTWSAVASTSAGREVRRCHVVVLGPARSSRGRLRATTVVMEDALDAGPAVAALKEIETAGGRAVQIFAKAEADPSGSIRGHRHTMLTDSDIGATRHARAAVGGLLAGLTGQSDIYVSGGAEHQGPAGGGPVTIVWTT